jgi:hypothetical protein
MHNSVKIRKLGQGLTALGSLRNYSNYESLLIAHEKHHSPVTELFKRLERKSGLLATEAINFAVTAYLAYLRYHPILDEERQEHIVTSDGYILGRLNHGIREKILDCQEAEDELDRLIRELRFQTDNIILRTPAVEEIERRTEMTQFSGKNNLFDSVECKIQVLEDVDRL